MLKLPIVFSQWDDRWANILLGFNKSTPFNIYNYGCLITCQAMVARYFDKEFDPKLINEKYISMGVGKAFKSGSGLYVPGGFTLLFGDCKETRVVTPSRLTDAQITEIKNAIDEGWPVMVQLDVNPRTVENDMHFVLIVGYNPSDENDFTIADPLGGKIRSLKDYLGWFKPDARVTIEQYTVFNGPKPKVVTGMISVSLDHYQLFNRNHDKWHQLVNYLEIGADPNTTTFEQVKSVIGGYKSRSTDLQNKLTELETEVKNREEQVGRLKDQLLEQEKLQKALNIKLNEALKNANKTDGLYEARIIELQGKIDVLAKEKGELNKTIATKETEITGLKDKVVSLSEGNLKQASIGTLINVLLEKIIGNYLNKGGDNNA